MKEARYRIEVYYMVHDPRGEALRRRFLVRGFDIDRVFITDNYLIDADIGVGRMDDVGELLVQPVTQTFSLNHPCDPGDFDYAVEIGYLPGVTDNVATTVRESIEDLLKTNLEPDRTVFSSITYFLSGVNDRSRAEELSRELYNPLIQRSRLLSRDEYRRSEGFGRRLPLVELHEETDVREVNLDVDEEELLRIGREGIEDGSGERRGPLALDLVSMGVIKNYFREREKRNPTDIEMESIAQTWSEHCKHTIFAASMDNDVPDGIFRRYIREATVRIRREKGKDDICRSVFSDNAGGIVFDDTYIIADKVETHNSPSALDPFGGAITGIVGVNRDAIGFGMASKPVANRYGFCFAYPDDDSPLYKTRDPESRMLSPRRIMEGVIHGVNVGGNTSGIPTPQGFIYFHPRYKGKPLVFVGTLGLVPEKVAGRQAVHKKAMPGDAIVMAGGRVGRDGIHGATFSSEALSSGSPATAVQIGDPITQKKMSDAIVKEARDLGLYHSITDNGAGGLSCSVAEMARECGGFEVELEDVPLKYPGLSPWQIWVSESQERMTLAVSPEKVEQFCELMKRRGVEATVIGRFNESDRGIVRHKGEEIFNLDMTFLHDGLPQKSYMTSYTPRGEDVPDFKEGDLSELLLKMLARLNLASYAFISTQYDHEVQGTSVIKPLQGKGRVNASAAVIRPVLDSPRAVVLSQGLYPTYTEIDSYRMAACSIDTAIRNAIAAGGRLDHMAILDNFCWTDSNNPERLGQLKEAARACYETAVAYGTPFISGKDSMFNDFHGFDADFNEIRISIPPTLLISSLGVIEDINICQTLDFKFPGMPIYLLGETSSELGGSEYLAMRGEEERGEAYLGTEVPEIKTDDFVRQYRFVERAMRERLVSSSISVERGGLGVALARSSMAGETGCRIYLEKVPVAGAMREDTLLFSESQGRIILSVYPEAEEHFISLAGDIPLSRIGETTDDGMISLCRLDGGEKSVPVSKCLDSYTAWSRGQGGGY